MQMNLFAGQEERCRCKEQMCGHRRWRGIGKGSGLNWEIRISIYTLPCAKIDSWWERAI